MKFTGLDINDPNWAEKFTDKWFDKCKDLKVDPIKEFLTMLESSMHDDNDEISLSE